MKNIFVVILLLILTGVALSQIVNNVSDLNHNGKVDLHDLKIFADGWPEMDPNSYRPPTNYEWLFWTILKRVNTDPIVDVGWLRLYMRRHRIVEVKILGMDNKSIMVFTETFDPNGVK